MHEMEIRLIDTISKSEEKSTSEKKELERELKHVHDILFSINGQVQKISGHTFGIRDLVVEGAE